MMRMLSEIFIFSVVIVCLGCSNSHRSRVDMDGGIPDEDEDVSVCGDGSTRCNDPEQVEKCVDGGWILWDDCGKMGWFCVVMGGEAECRETEEKKDDEWTDEWVDEHPDEEIQDKDGTADIDDEETALPDDDDSDTIDDADTEDDSDHSEDWDFEDEDEDEDAEVFPDEENGCNKGTYTDTSFTTGTHSDTMASPPGTLSVAEDYDAWTVRYDADGLPENYGWTENAPSGWTTKQIVSGDRLHLSSIDKNAQANYSRNPSLNNTTGGVVEVKMQLSSTEGDYGNAIEIQNGSRGLLFHVFTDHIVEDGSGLSGTINTTASSNVYRITQKNNDFNLYANGNLLINGAGQSLSGGTLNVIRFHDIATLSDSEAFYDYIYYYNGGDVLPKKASGNYLSARIDTGTTSNDVGTGATVSWNGTGTGTTMDVFASNSTTLPGAPCATGLSTSGATIPGTCDGRYVWIRANLNNADATLESFTLNYCIL